MKGWTTRSLGMPSPDQILDQAPTKTREIKIEANVIAYFGDLLMAWKQAATKVLKPKN